MPIDTVNINTRSPPGDVVLDAKEMSTLPNAIVTDVHPHDDGWEVVTKGGETEEGPPFDVQTFIDKVKEAAGDAPIDFLPEPADNQARAIYTDGRFE